jgi:hypothetical protein
MRPVWHGPVPEHLQPHGRTRAELQSSALAAQLDAALIRLREDPVDAA